MQKATPIPTVKLSNGVECPLIGLGTYIGFPPNKELVGPLIKKAILEYGYRLFDCSKVYDTEHEIGVALNELFNDPKSGIKREDIIVVDKVWLDDMHDIEGALRTSLKRFNLDYVDIYLSHWPNPEIIDKEKMKCKPLPLHKRWKVMEDCVRKGLCKAIGCSNFNCQILVDLLSYAEIKPVVNQIELHPYLPQTNLVRYCQLNDIQVMAYAPLCNPATASLQSKPVTALTDPTVMELAKKYGKTPGQICLNWALQRKHILIPATTKFERLAEYMGSKDFALTEKEMETMNTLPVKMRMYDPAIWTFFDWGKIPLFE